MPHPIERFRAGPTMTAGQPLKLLIGKRLVTLIGESFAAVHAPFDRRRFARRANRDLDALEMKERSRHVAAALAAELPPGAAEAMPSRTGGLPPQSERTEDNGLRPFFYFPHSSLIAQHGIGSFAHGMRACRELTQRFTAEFCVRPFLERYRDQALRLLTKWTRSRSAHVRRLVSEGTRPRLPWASHLRELQADPHLALPLLERLKDDPELYVRRSVANHLGDILKDHPDVAFARCEQWLGECAGLAPETAKSRKWLLRHAVRLPSKRGDARALAIRMAAR